MKQHKSAMRHLNVIESAVRVYQSMGSKAGEVSVTDHFNCDNGAVMARVEGSEMAITLVDAYCTLIVQKGGK